VFPAADRVTGAARLDPRRVLPVHVNRAREAELAVLERDRVAALRDAIDGAVERPVEQDARRLATHARVLGRAAAERVGGGLARLGVGDARPPAIATRARRRRR